ncbi:hypothetical protein [Capnocytophaga catalasegens]|uniref:Uncharacterized protein n=1 Tax=Capnocytophaga catalasegens TaxID=1004260 RepID=A0AAV5ARC9_9FLAO|nr:hypothetical protein [Capnocytophaga catalasegens]GIZ15498.1 hypothetical protein RCZ03_14980 [Capnocytophaga catalasegens]GJM49841.1 hypothetical protein RCZ15_08160 [Capnocytophaga catalasegens]GJM54013.1 hypothetical protein RCZ16_23290 [Capnocytophaga catalasegens]
MNIEERVSETILEEKKQITIQGETYNVAPPTIRTLIKFSKYVSAFPKEELDQERPVASLLLHSDKLHNVGYALACIILGNKEFEKKEETIFEEVKREFLFKKIIKQKVIVSEKSNGELLAEKINNAPIEEVLNVFFLLLKFMKLSDFFQLTTSLIEMNLTKATKTAEVVKETTAFGDL